MSISLIMRLIITLIVFQCGDCDLMRSTSASRTRQRWSGDARSATSVKRATETALSVSLCCLITISHLETTETQEHSNNTLFYHAPSLRRHERRSSTQREAARTRANQSPVEKLPKDPVIVVGGGELVARELAAREHHPAAETTAAPSRSRSDRGRTWSTKQLLRV